VYHFFFSVTNLEENFLQTVKENTIAWEEQSARKIYCGMINVHIILLGEKTSSVDLRMNSYLAVVGCVSRNVIYHRLIKRLKYLRWYGNQGVLACRIFCHSPGTTEENHKKRCAGWLYIL